jgi:hypothetical protein
MLKINILKVGRFNVKVHVVCRLGSSVSIATSYGLDGPGSNPSGGKIFHACPHRSWGPPSLLYNVGTGSFPAVNSSWGMTLTLHPLLVPWSWEGRSIPLLPLWAVRPVQSLSACTRVHFTFTLHVVYSARNGLIFGLISANYIHWRLVMALGRDSTQKLRELAFHFDTVYSGTKEKLPLWVFHWLCCVWAAVMLTI